MPNINLKWTEANLGDLGNENVDYLEKEACSKMIIHFYFQPTKTYIKNTLNKLYI